MAVGNIPGIVLLLGATVLLVLASLSTPVLKDFSYLKAEFDGVSFAGQSAGESTLSLGLWGACIVTPAGRSCTPKKLGYGLNLDILNIDDSTRLAQSLLRGTAKALILIPIAAGISFIAFLFALSTNVFLDVIASCIALLGAFVTLIAFILASVVFITAKYRINKHVDGVQASLQNCYWFLVAALAADLLASCFVLFGCVKRRRHRDTDRRLSNMSNGSNGGAMYGEKRHFWQRRRTTADPMMTEKRGNWWNRRSTNTAVV